MKIIKRNGQQMSYDSEKIYNAIKRANNSVEEGERLDEEQLQKVTKQVDRQCRQFDRALNVEEIQDIVEKQLMKNNYYQLAKEYVTYRYIRTLNRKKNTIDDKILSLTEGSNEEVKQENSNKNPIIASTQRDYVAGEVSKDLTERVLLPKDIIEAHKEGIIHFHDQDYFLQHIHNCDLWNLEDILQNGTVINGTKIEKPHRFLTACNIATQIVALVASSQYGGQTFTLSHLAPFVDISRKAIRKELEDELKDVSISKEKFEEIVEKRLKEEIKDGVQTIQYQIITLQTTNGQAPFVTVFMYLNEVKDEQTRNDLALIIEETLKQRMKGVKNEKGVWITPAFPKLIYVLQEDNINEGSKYYYLTELAAKCTAKRMVPDYISEKVMKEIKKDKNGVGHCFPSMGCRSFLSVWDEDPDKYYSRFNKGVVTINLVDVACSSSGENYNKDIESFYKIFNERLELCHKALLCRYERLKGTPSDVAPILWQYGALARLEKGETIDKLLIGGYSTISLGYAGLWECVYELTGKKLIDEEGKKLGLEIMQYMNDKCQEWNNELNLGYSTYGTPIESTTYKFAKCLQRRFGVIEGVTDKNYITNSYHIKVTENIDAFSKLSIESEFQALSTGGAISYVETANLQNNIPAVMQVLKHIYNNIMYAELNTKSDYCQVCGYDGEIPIVEEDGKLVFKCPNCNNSDRNKLNIARRVCGYISTNEFNQGRTQEIKERVLHL